MTNLAKQVAGSRAGKSGNQLFDNFKQPMTSKRKVGIPEDRKQVAGMVKVSTFGNTPARSQKMSLIPSLSSLGKLGGSKKLVNIKKKVPNESGTLTKAAPKNFWESEEIGGFGELPVSTPSSISSLKLGHKSKPKSSKSPGNKLGVKLKAKSPGNKLGVKLKAKSPGVKLNGAVRHKSKSTSSVEKTARKRSRDSVEKQKSADVIVLGNSKQQTPSDDVIVLGSSSEKRVFVID